MPNSLVEQVERLLQGPRPVPIVTAGDPVLRREARLYDGELDGELWVALIEAMRETMQAAPGVGLAAPQIGLSLAVAVIEDLALVSPEVADSRDRVPVDFRVIVNPVYRPVGSRLASFYEGCLSVPGYQAVVRRAAAVHLRCNDIDGNEVDQWVSGWHARIVAHETDHLNGTLYLDRAELRSLTSNENYLGRWGSPSPDEAAEELGFDLADPS